MLAEVTNVVADVIERVVSDFAQHEGAVGVIERCIRLGGDRGGGGARDRCRGRGHGGGCIGEHAV